MALHPIPVEVLEGEDLLLFAQAKHIDKTLIEQADYTDYSLKIIRLGAGQLSLLDLPNQTPLSDVVITTDKLEASLETSDGLWDLGGDPAGYNVLLRIRQADLSPSPMIGGRHYLASLELAGGSTYGDEFVQWDVNCLKNPAT